MTIELSGCYIPDNAGRLLVIHRNLRTLKWWEIIGGKIEPDEKSEDAAAREAREELGVKVIPRTRLYCDEFRYDGESFAYDVWRADLVAGTPYPQESIHDMVEWRSINDLRREDHMSPVLTHLVKKIVDGEVAL